jgi:long-subunit fatty acid transport protein
MRIALAVALALAGAGTAAAQDQQLGARTKAMGGSYTAFEDDPVSIWLNPAGIATQPDQMSVVYQTTTAYPVTKERGPGDTVLYSVEPEMILGEPAIIPSYLGFVFQVGSADSPMAVGLCYAQPYHLDYAMDLVTDPDQTVYKPRNEMKQSMARFRTAFAYDIRFAPSGGEGFLNHLALGVGADVGYERWEFQTQDGRDESDSGASLGYGAGLLLGVYDNTRDLKINLGVAYQSAVRFSFSTEPDLLPAFDMPQQLNAGLTLYLLDQTPLRITLDLQWVAWSETAESPLFPTQPEFQDAYNYSIGAEYRVRIPGVEGIDFYPRLGFRRFAAPWEDKDDLPAIGAYKLVLDTKGEVFNIVTFGLGVSWTSAAGKVRSVDLAADIGGDSPNVAVGLTYEF